MERRQIDEVDHMFCHRSEGASALTGNSLLRDLLPLTALIWWPRFTTDGVAWGLGRALLATFVKLLTPDDGQTVEQTFGGVLVLVAQLLLL